MSRFVVALDGMSGVRAVQLARQLSGKVWGFKVNDLLIDYGVRIVGELKEFGNVFADPKLHDIPNTVANGVAKLVNAGADLITVHASGGGEMLEKAVEAGGNRILAVTVLTSMSNHDLRYVYGDPECQMGELMDGRSYAVIRFAKIARKANCWGVVCAAGDLPYVPAGMRTVVPGFRPHGLGQGDDQKHIGGFKEVQGANLIVVGRPVTEAKDPVATIEGFNKAMEGR